MNGNWYRIDGSQVYGYWFDGTHDDDNTNFTWGVLLVDEYSDISTRTVINYYTSARTYETPSSIFIYPGERVLIFP